MSCQQQLAIRLGKRVADLPFTNRTFALNVLVIAVLPRWKQQGSAFVSMVSYGDTC